MKFFCTRFLWIRFCLAMLALVLGATAFAQQAPVPSQISGEISSSRMMKLPHTTHPLISSARDTGRISSNSPMQHILLVLQPSADKQAALAQFLVDQQNPASPRYHSWLTASQFADQFAPSAADVAQVSSWLRSQGFTVNSVAAGRRWIDFSGTAGTVEQTFATTMHSYVIGGESHIANASDISIPTALGSLVKGVVRLNNFYKRTPLSVVKQFSFKKGAAPTVTRAQVLKNGKLTDATPALISNSGSEFVTPGDLQTIYDAANPIQGGTDGTGASVAVVGRSNIQITDIQAFRTIFGLPAQDPQIILVGPDPGTGTSDELESDLDLEYAGAMAPKAAIKFVIAQSTDTADGVDLAAAYAVDNRVAPIISESYGECEAFLGTAGNSFYGSLWQQASAEGISALVSTGDSGSAGCDSPDGDSAAADGLQVSGIASTPYNTAVGGTMFDNSALGTPYWTPDNSSVLSNAAGYVPETTWNEVCDPTLPVSATGNCRQFAADPRFAYYLLYGGGGGASSCTQSTMTSNPDGSVNIDCTAHYDKPSWQTGPGVPADSARDIPDVSFTAAGSVVPYIICTEGSCQYEANSDGSYDLYGATSVGGTSASTPTFAGVVALLNQKYGSYQGLLNYKLYQFAATQDPTQCSSLAQTDPTQRGTCIFHDVTTGTNAMPCITGTQNCSQNQSGENLLTGYAATAGYDQATGLGSVDVANLIAAWNTSSRTSTSTKLTMTPTTAAHGASVQLSGTVAPNSGGGTPTGAIVLQSSTGQSLGSFPLTSGAYSATIDDLPGGNYTVTAHYGGDASFDVSDSTAVSLNIASEASATTTAMLAFSYTTNAYAPATSASYGDQILLRANVAGVSGRGTPTGNLTLSLDGASLGTFTVTPEGSVEVYSGYQTNPGIFPGVGSHTLSAAYAGDSSFNASSSSSYSFNIAKDGTNTFVAGSTYSPNTNQQILLTGYVNSNNPYLPVTPTGTVQFYDNGTAIGSPATLQPASRAMSSGGSLATLAYAFPTAGAHNVTLTYGGDSTFSAPPNSYPTTFTVKDGAGAATVVTSSASSLRPMLGQGVSFSISVSPKSASSNVPTGTVTLSSGTSSFANTPGYTVNLTGGTAVLQTSFINAGATPVFFSYSGDANFAPATGQVLPLVVQQITPATTLTASAPLIAPGAQTTFELDLVGSTNSNAIPAASGSVQFYDSVNGAAAVALGSPHTLTLANGSASYKTAAVTVLAAQLAVGTHSVYAVYGGDTNYAGVTSPPVTVVVSTPDFAMTPPTGGISVTAGSSASGTVDVQSVLGFAGTIVVGCNTASLPAGVACNVSPSSVSGAGNVTVTLNTSASGAQSANANSIAAPAIFSLAGVFLLFTLRRNKIRQLFGLWVIAFAGGILLLNGCGGSGKQTATVTVSSSASKAAYGSTVTLTATIDPDHNATPDGSVIFSADGKQIGQPAAVVGGSAKLDVDSLPVGVHSITAAYAGDSHISAATSSKYLQAITGDTTVQLTAVSGSLSHTLNVPVHLN